VTWRQGLPVTTIPRTLSDLVRSGLAQEWIHQAVQQALERGLICDSRVGLDGLKIVGAIPTWAESLERWPAGWGKKRAPSGAPFPLTILYCTLRGAVSLLLDSSVSEMAFNGSAMAPR